MNKFRICLLLALCLGSAAAWAVNYKRYGHRVARFGPFTMDGEMTPENAMSMLGQDTAEALGRVDLPVGRLHNFGVLAPGDKGEHTFIVKNIGEGDLKLRLGATTCKCTLGTLESEVLKPGEQTDIKLEWSIEPGTHSTAFSQRAQVLTDDPGNVAIDLAIAGKVIGDIEMFPPAWSFGEVAAGEPFEISGTVYSYYDHEIVPTKMTFTDDYLNDYSEFEVEPFDPKSEDDETHAAARQAFRVRVKVGAGIRQGAVSQSFMFGFQKKGDDGSTVKLQSTEGDDDPNDYASARVTGRVVGALGMISGPRIKGRTGGGYIYDFGRLDKDDALIGKSFVVLKGSERENTNLSIGEVNPTNVIRAKLGEPKGRGSMTLYPLEIEILPGDEPVARLGKSKEDYGNVWIESDNPKVPKMRIAVKFAVDPR